MDGETKGGARAVPVPTSEAASLVWFNSALGSTPAVVLVPP